MPASGFDKANTRIGKAMDRALTKVDKVLGEPDDDLVFYESLTLEELAQVQNKFPGEFPAYIKEMEIRRLARQDGD